jgi:peptide chain release factor subunit 1
MADTVTWSLLRELATFRAENGCATTIYLNLDPSDVPTAGDAQTRMSALLNSAEKVDRKDLTHEQRGALKADFERIARWFDDEFERDGAQAVAVFAAGLDNFWTTLALPGPAPDRFKVAVVGREQGHLYRLEAGRLQEIGDYSDETPGRHDQGGWSQGRYQRHIEKLVQDHVKDVAEVLDRSRRRLHVPKIVLVCSEDMRSEFTDALSVEAREAVVGWAPAEAHAGPAQLLQAVAPVLTEAETKDEAEVLSRWREEAGRNARAAAGWEQTLEAASDGRVELLLFLDGIDHPAFRCPACGRASASGGSCPLDGTTLEETDAGLDLAVHQTLAHGGAVWAIRYQNDLSPVEGIGALLRF